MELILYKTKSKNTEINKELTDEISFSVNAKTRVNQLNPEIKLHSTDNLQGYNYLYFEGFERYYFINEIEIKPNDVYTLYCSVDVLETYKDDILNSENIADNQDVYVDIDILESNVTIDTEPSYILTTLGVDY